MTKVLDIYVAKHCLGTDQATRLAAGLRQQVSGIEVKVTVLDEMPEDDRPCIAATPSYFLDGHLLFLGNPRLEELVAKIASFSTNKGPDNG